MKKLLCLIVVMLSLMFSMTALADYKSFYDVIGDVQNILGNYPDEAWTMTVESAKSVAQALEGFSCAETDNVLTCEKNDRYGEYQLVLLFKDDNLAALECAFTAPSLQDLNYQKDSFYVYVADDLQNRLAFYGLIPTGTAQKKGENLFSGTATAPYGAIYQISDNTVLQVGFNPKSDLNPKFKLAFLVTEKSADFELPAQSLTYPQSTAVPNQLIPSVDAAQNNGRRIMLTVSENNVKADEAVRIEVYAPGADKVRLYDTSNMLWVEQEGERIFFVINGTDYTLPPLSFYALASFDGIWSNEKSNTETVTFLKEGTYIPAEQPVEVTTEDIDFLYEKYVITGPEDRSIKLWLSANDSYQGIPVKVYAEAPWADEIKFYLSNGAASTYGSGTANASLVEQWDTHQNCVGTISYTAEASYNGEYSGIKSNTETITYKYYDWSAEPAIKVPDKIVEKEPFHITIKPVSFCDGKSYAYNVQLINSSGNTVCGKTHVMPHDVVLGDYSSYGFPIKPLIPGKYTIRVSVESITPIADIEANITIEEKNIVWSVEDGILKIGGQGYFEAKDVPWKGFKNEIRKVIVEDGITTIGPSYFANFSNLEEIIMPEGLVKIYDRAFYNCSKLSKINLPQSLEHIESQSFYGCESLSSIVIPDKISSIQPNVFENSGLTEISLPDNLSVISQGAFAGSKLQTIDMPAAVIKIGDGAFTNCTQLTSVTIPHRVKELYRTFKDCTALKNITFSGQVFNIGDGIFEGCTNLEEIKLPESVETIGNNTFKGASSLKIIVLPKNVKEISGASVFAETDSLESVWIPESVKSVNKNAYDGIDETKIHYYNLD